MPALHRPPRRWPVGRGADILGLLGTALMAPAVMEMYALTGPDRRVVRGVVAVVGLGAMVAIVWLQFPLITERLTFEQQIGPVSVAYVAIGAWFVAGGWLASRAGIMSGGARLGALAATDVGQPWWAYRWGRRLLEASTGSAASDQMDRSAATAGREVGAG